MMVLDCEQGSDEWFAERFGYPSASAAGSIITPKRGDLSARADEYIAQLIVELVEGRQETYQSYDMLRGIEMESEARDWYAFRYDVDVETVGAIRNKGCMWSPDGIVGWADARPIGGIEFKSPKSTTHVKYLLAGTLPDEYRPQCHAALWIGELQWLDFVSYAPPFKPLVLRVTPDDYTKKVGKALTEFIQRYEAAREKIIADK